MTSEAGLTLVGGLTVGHAHDLEAATGCTAILGPFRGAVEVHGLATGTRELDALSPVHLVPVCDAILLTGGSAFGLAAAAGVVAWLEERGRGFPTRAARVPIVPAAVLYDLGIGRADVRPGPAMGRAAAEAASAAPVPEGRVGAGAGATVGKALGPEGAEAGGLGSWGERRDGVAVAALAAVNAFGDVLDARGEVLAGCRRPDGGFLDTARALREGGLGAGIGFGRGEGPARAGPEAGGRAPAGPGPAESTTLAVVATDAPLGKTDLQVVARLAAGALPRRISPSGTAFDGDLVFALSTGSAPGSGARREEARREEARREEPALEEAALEGAESEAAADPAAEAPAGVRAALEVLALGLRARAALETAIERAVTVGRRGEGP